MPAEMGSLDAYIETIDSIIRYLTLPSITPRVNKEPWEPTLDFTKSIVVTSNNYLKVIGEQKQAKINATNEKENLCSKNDN